MKELKFAGSSDDTFGVYGDIEMDYDNCANGKPIEFLISNSEYSILVIGQYAPNNYYAGQQISVCNYDPELNDKSFPDWEIKIQQDSYSNYNPVLIILTPDDVQIECLQERK